MNEDTASCQPRVSANFWYILKRSPANRAASSPPVPPRISTMAFFASSGSAGIRRSLMRSSNFGSCAVASSISSRASCRISSSLSDEIIIFDSSMADSAFSYFLLTPSNSSRSWYSLVRRTYLFRSEITAGSVIRVDTSSNRASRPSRRDNSIFSDIIILRERGD